MNPVKIETERGVMTATLTDVENRNALGGGVGLACALDISIAADDVKFGFTEVRLGVAPAIISVVCLPKMRPGEEAAEGVKAWRDKRSPSWAEGDDE